MAHELIPTKDEMQAIAEIVKQAVDSKYVEKLGGYAGVFSIAIYARELGIPIMTAIFGGVSNIMGKITLSPQLMNAMIRKAGHKLKIDSNDERCIIEGIRTDTGEVCSASFSIVDATKAGLVKPGSGWHKYPSDMCFARCLSRLARRLFPDVIGTAYVEGEIDPETSKNPHKNENREMVEIVPEVIQVPVELISEDQADEIEAFLVITGGDYRSKLLAFFSEKMGANPPIDAFRFLPIKYYDSCLKAVKRGPEDKSKTEKPV